MPDLALPQEDLWILVGYLLGMVAFGVWIGRSQKGAADYMVGGRNLPWWLVLFSIVATETSTVTFLSIPGEGWSRDLTWLQLPIGFAIGRLLVVFVLLPGYFRGQIYTAYEVLHERFGGMTERVASVMFLVTRTLADGLRLYLSAIALQLVTGIDMRLAIVVMGVATIVYTFVGGIRAVVWTDLVQFVVYVGGALLAFQILLEGIDGGWSGLVARAENDDKLRVFDFTATFAEVNVFWAGLIGGSAVTFATHGVDQLFVQRYLCARSRTQASVALGVSGVLVIAQFALFLLIGVALWAWYGEHQPDRVFEKADRVFASFIVEELPIGVRGILLGAVFSAAMSTLSSSLNSSATSLQANLWRPLVRPDATDREQLWTVRTFTVLFGLLQIGVGIAGREMDASVVNAVLGIASLALGIILGVFLLGVATRRVGEWAALVGLLLGAIVVTWAYFDDSVAWPWYSLIGATATFVAGYAASFVFPRIAETR